MPVLGKEAKYYDYVPIFPYSHERIDAAINFYKANSPNIGKFGNVGINGNGKPA
jgi:vancomycin permeability regulator SanA